MIRSYDELVKIENFKDRYEYLKLGGGVGKETFGFDRYLNQVFYQSQRWRRVRDEVIMRDNGCDLSHADYPIYGQITIHHMNPISLDDIRNETDLLINPNYLICVSHKTHNAIHYGDDTQIFTGLTFRSEGDTKLW